MSLTPYPDLTERLCLSMPPLPITPSKVDEGIEKVKQSLSAKWGIRFPVRDATYSPSKRDMSLAEEKILVLIQLLYFRGGALDYAIEQFEENAAQIISKWQFKPYGEPDVLLSLEASKSALKQDFLKKRPALSQKAVTELTENLKHFLNLIADRVKAGEKFPKSVKTNGKKSHFYSSFDRLKFFQINQFPRMNSRPPSPTCLSASRASRYGCDPEANRGPQKAESHQLSTPHLLTTTQTTKWQISWTPSTLLQRSLPKLQMHGRLVNLQNSNSAPLRKIHSRLHRPLHHGAKVRVWVLLRTENDHTLTLCKHHPHGMSLGKHRLRNQPKRLVAWVHQGN